MKIRVKRFDKSLPLPEREDRAVGFDLYCRESVTIKPQTVALVPLNTAVAIPDGYVVLLIARSSTPLRKGLMLANGVGIIDPFFGGDKDEVKAQFFNFTAKPVNIEKGEALTQAIFIKVEDVELEEVKTLGTDGHGGYWI